MKCYTVAGEDYVAVVGEPLVFDLGVDRVCHNVTIIQDDDCENLLLTGQIFSSTLRYETGIMPIEITVPTATVTIDDNNEPECGKIWYDC